MRKRKIIEIDRTICNGCGQCVGGCAEGALALIDGKAQLVSDVYCDGLGACIGECPTGALRIIEREADGFDEDQVREHVGRARASTQEVGSFASQPEKAALVCGCPGSHEMTLKRKAPHDPDAAGSPQMRSELTHWPIKLRLLNPRATYLAGSDLVLLADCAAAAYPNLHARFLKDRAVALACPKFDDPEEQIERLTEVVRDAGVRSVTVVHMEVPCCHGLMTIAEEALDRGGTDAALSSVIVSRAGEGLHEGAVPREKREGIPAAGR